MEAYMLEAKLHDLVHYMTDYLRIVIENGKSFKKENFFMMIQELSHEHIVTESERYFKIMIEEL